MTFHDFRRTFKTNAARAGISKAYRDAIVGHSPQDMDMHYIKLTDDDLHKAMNRYVEWYENEAENIESGQGLVKEIRK